MIAVSLFLILAAAEPEAAQFYAPNEELRAYLLEAGENHPELRALHEEWLAALERIPQAKSLDDPMFGFTYILQAPAGWGRYSAMLSQMFPWFGTLRKRGEKAAVEADAALARFCTARNMVFGEVKKAYFDYAYLAESVRVVEAQVEVLKFTEDIVRSRYSLGISPQEDLLRVQIEQTKLQDRYDEYNQYRPALSARLCAMIGREPGEDLPWPQAADLPAPPPPAPIILARMRVANPTLNEADLKIESSEIEIELARKKRFPDAKLGIEYMDMTDVRNMSRPGPFLDAVEASRELSMPARVALPSLPDPNATPVERIVGAVDGVRTFRTEAFERSIGGTMNLNDLVMLENAFDNIKMKDQVGVTLEFNLPIYRKRIKAAIEEARHMHAASQHDKQKRTQMLNAEAKMALFAYQDGARRLKLYEESLIPQAEKTYEAVQVTYSSGDINADFLDLLMSAQTLLDFDLEKARAARDVQIAAADLEVVMGGPWEAAVADAEADSIATTHESTTDTKPADEEKPAASADTQPDNKSAGVSSEDSPEPVAEPETTK
ncbi:MAG: TolC family protein [Candidatus Hydrogenedentes bacterium]|nr:TolC family protein [Candidatus Hydrogenedentota bacterium]